MIDALKAFLAVQSHGNFSKAARASGVAVSSISRKIETLEAEFGAALFNRSTRELLLTDAGERLIPLARSIVAEVAEARQAVQSLSAEPSGPMTISAPGPFGRRHVAPGVADFLKHYPRLEVNLHAEDAIIDVAHARIDVAIRIGVLPNSDLIATHLAPQRRITCASPEYIAKHGRPSEPQALLRHNCLTTCNASPRVGWWRFSGVNDHKPLDVHGTFRADDSDVLMQGALAGLGIAHLATWLVYDEIANGRLIPLFQNEVSQAPLTRSAIHAVRVKGRASTKAKLFVDHLRRYFGVENGQEPYWDRLGKNT